MSEVDQVIDIRDPEINTEEIMNRIREHIRQRRAQAAAQGLEYDRLAQDDINTGAMGRLAADLYYDLQQINSSAETIAVTLAMRDRHFPLLNPLLFRIEKLLHRLALKYTNLLAGRQVVFNRATAHVITGLVHTVEQSDAHIEQLEKELDLVRERLTRLEKNNGLGSAQ